MTYTQQGISVTFTRARSKRTFYVEVKIPSTVAKQPRTCVVENKDFRLTLIRKRPCFNDIVICFCEDYVVKQNGELSCDKPLLCSYEDEFYRYEITLQPSIYAPPSASDLLPREKSLPQRRNPRTPLGLTSPRLVPYTHSNVRKPYSGGRVASK